MSDLFSAPAEPLVLRDYQIGAMEGARANIRAGKRRQIICAPTGAGKCLGRGTPVLMADGTIKPVEDVRVGDRLASPTGGYRTVLSLGRGRERMFRVVPTKGDPYIVNASHILSLRKTPSDGVLLADGSHIAADADIVNVPAAVLYASNRTARHVLKGWRAGIEKFEKGAEVNDLPIPPYVLGIWLGDGLAAGAALSKPYGAIVERWLKYGEAIGLGTRFCTPENLTTYLTNGRGQKNALVDKLRALGVLNNKHVPSVYKTAARQARLELVAGMIDTDGHLTNGCYDWISCSEQMAHDFAFLCRSLGLACYIAPCTKGIVSTGFSGNYWRCSVSGDINELPLEQKRHWKRRLQKKRHLVHGITLEPLPEDDYFGFEIDGDRLFMLGDFTVTHNTVIALGFMQAATEAGSKSAFLTDRTALIDQTSQAMDKYGIRHGVMQADHWRSSPYALVQLVSAQTLGRRLGKGGYVDHHLRDLKFVLIDEAHTIYQSTLDWLATLPEHVAVIGLTATPFTKGLGKHYQAIINAATTDGLVAAGVLVKPIVYSAVEADMSGVAVKSTGEWDDHGLESAGVKIVGDVAAEYLRRTTEHFGGPVKTIVFSSTVVHGEEICRAFAGIGLNFQNISYHDDEDERRAKIAEFRKPDSAITGLVSCDALAKGFDVPDVRVCILGRPLRKSLTTHIQQIGRVMRSARGKDKALVIDHTGNALRFLNDTVDFWAKGVDELDENAEKDKAPRSVTEKERKDLVCGGCKAVMLPGMRVCPACGWERPQRTSNVTVVTGNTQKLELRRNASRRFDFDNHPMLRDPAVAYQCFLAYSADRKGGDNDAARKWAAGLYKGVYDQWPPRRFHLLPHAPDQLTIDVERFCKREMARFAKSRTRHAA